MDAMQKLTSGLPEEVRAELALRRIWTLAPDEAGGAPELTRRSAVQFTRSNCKDREGERDKRGDLRFALL